MKFSIWLVVALALLPVLALFSGVSVSAGHSSVGEPEVLGALGIGIGVVLALALHALDRA
jgi:hypothetical protein